MEQPLETEPLSSPSGKDKYVPATSHQHHAPHPAAGPTWKGFSFSALPDLATPAVSHASAGVDRQTWLLLKSLGDMLPMPGTETSPSQLRSKWKLMVRMQKYSGNKAQSRSGVWKATGKRAPHTLYHLCFFVYSPNRQLASFNQLAYGPIHQPQLHLDSESPRGLSARLLVN